MNKSTNIQLYIKNGIMPTNVTTKVSKILMHPIKLLLKVLLY